MRRDQSTVELVALARAVVAVLLVAGRSVAGGALPRDLAAAVRRALTHARTGAHGDRAALRSRSLGPLIRRYAPVLVLERDAFGVDASVPVDFRGCRALGCAAFPGSGDGVRPRRRGAPDAIYVEYLALLPRLAHGPPARSRRSPATTATTGRARSSGSVATARPRRASARTRASPACGRGGRGDPGWRAVAPRPVVYRAAGSHANGFGPGDIDLAGDRWNGTAGTVTTARARARRRGAVAPARGSTPAPCRRGARRSTPTRRSRRPRPPAGAARSRGSPRSGRRSRRRRDGNGGAAGIVLQVGASPPRAVLGRHPARIRPPRAPRRLLDDDAAPARVRASVPALHVVVDRPRAGRAGALARRAVADRGRHRSRDPAA